MWIYRDSNRAPKNTRAKIRNFFPHPFLVLIFFWMTTDALGNSGAPSMFKLYHTHFVLSMTPFNAPSFCLCCLRTAARDPFIFPMAGTPSMLKLWNPFNAPTLSHIPYLVDESLQCSPPTIHILSCRCWKPSFLRSWVSTHGKNKWVTLPLPYNSFTLKADDINFVIICCLYAQKMLWTRSDWTKRKGTHRPGIEFLTLLFPFLNGNL